MCGITGFLTASTTRDGFISQVRAMTEAITHRGPDGGGVWVDADAGIALGHRRLSILDLSPAGAQPMHSKCGRYVIVFNGEIYHFAVLRKTLEGNGALTASCGENYFRARKAYSSGVIEGLNNKANVTMRKAYGFRTFGMTAIALYHALGKLPEPELTHRFY